MAEKKKVGNIIFRFFQGILLGSSGILPGVSGGVLCVVFGIYKPLMELLANPIKKAKEHYKLLLPVGIGAATGFFLVISILKSVMDSYKSLAECFFVGLIVGTLPALFKAAGREKRSAGSYIALILGFVIVFSLLAYLGLVIGVSITPSFYWFVAAGAIFGISMVLPGLSAYTILEFLGLFQPLLAGVESFDMNVLVPVLIGGVGAFVGLAKLINMLYKKYFSIMSHIIIGIVVATIIPLVPTSFSGIGDAFVKLALILGGFIFAIVFENIGVKFEEK